MNKLQKEEEREGISCPMLAPPTFSLFSLLSLNIALPFSSSIILLSFLNRVKILQYYELKVRLLFSGKISIALLITLEVVAGGCTAASSQEAIQQFQPYFIEACSRYIGRVRSESHTFAFSLQQVLWLPLQSPYCYMQCTYNWDILLSHLNFEPDAAISIVVSAQNFGVQRKGM